VSNGRGGALARMASGFRRIFRRTNYRVRSARWKWTTARCADNVEFEVVVTGYPPRTAMRVDIYFVDDNDQETKFDEVPIDLIGGRIDGIWQAKGAADDKLAGRIRFKIQTALLPQEIVSSNVVNLRRMPDLPKTHYGQNRAHFDVETDGLKVKVSSEIKYLKGWGASVVALGGSAPANNAGAVAGFNIQGGPYWWMKEVRGRKKYWNGSAWRNLPRGFILQDANNFCVGFYKSGNSYTCQYGGNWPERFANWNINSPSSRRRINQWTDNIHDTWNDKFDIKRRGCASSADWCCRYQTEFSVEFKKQDALSNETLIVAPGNIRSNDSLWFLGEPRLSVAAHEFGHHLGNPDEYAGAAIDTSLNSDGAVNGIDADSIMGQNLTTVKRRHFRTICAHLRAMVRQQTRRTHRYRARSCKQPPAGGA